MERAESNVLIPGGGGAAGIGAIKSLKMCNFEGRIVSTDSDQLSAGLYLADRGLVVPRAEDPDFFRQTFRIIQENKINIILPTSGFDIIPYSKKKRYLEKNGVIAVISDSDVIQTCVNKLQFYRKLHNRFNMPYSTTNPSKIDHFPCIAKPIFGKGSRDIFICRDESEINRICSLHKNMLLQEYLPGREYTIDVLSDLEGNALIAIPRIRIEVKAGISVKGEIIIDEQLQEVCCKLAESLHVIGPSCVQMKCDEEDVPKIVEINPRMGGGTILTTYAGVNFPDLSIRMVNKERISIPNPKRVTMIRYFEEIILDTSMRQEYVS